MQMLTETPLYAIYWYDSEQTILVLEVRQSWTWDEARCMIEASNAILREQSHPTYGIIHLMENASDIPENNRGLITNLKRLLALDTTDEELMFMVGNVALLEMLINDAAWVHSFLSRTTRYRYVRTLKESITAIKHHKLQFHQTPIEVAWGNPEETVLLWTFPYQWTADDYGRAVQVSTALIEHHKHTVHILCDMRQTSLHPRDVLTMARFGFRHSTLNTGLIVLVTRNRFWRRMSQVMGLDSRFKNKLIFVDDIASGYRLLQAAGILQIHPV